MAFFYYASFPNSRNKNRAPTTAANTYQIAINEIGAALVRVAVASQNRTYILLQNFSATVEMFYFYATTLVIDPSAVSTFGLTDDLIYNPTSGILYQKQDDGFSTNWTIVLPQDVSEKIVQLQTASLESLQDIYMLANTVVPGTYIVGVDAGRG